MLIHSFVRLSICTLCGFAMLQFNLADALFAQRTPPRLPPPKLERPGGDRNQDDDDGEAFGGNSRSDSRRDKANSKFDELLADKDLSNFRGYEEEKIGEGWKIDGKYLHFDGSSIGDIITKKEYDNFELQFDYRVSEGGDSGVLYRVSLGDEKPYKSGPEFQVLDDENHADGKNQKTSAGSLHAMYAPENKKTRAAGSWNSVRIIVDGNSIQHYLNSIKVVEAEIGSDDWNERLAESKFKDWERFGKNSKGHIAFQENGDEIWYRNIRVKEMTDETTASNERSEKGSPPPAIGRSGRPSYRTPPASNRRHPRFYKETKDLGGDEDKSKGKGKKGGKD